MRLASRNTKALPRNQFCMKKLAMRPMHRLMAGIGISSFSKEKKTINKELMAVLMVVSERLMMATRNPGRDDNIVDSYFRA